MHLIVNRVDKTSASSAHSPNQRSRVVVAPDAPASTSPFLVLMEDWFKPPAGFPTHPHRGMETVTFVLEGEVIHQDHTGAGGRLKAGDVGFMTAGGGVLHSEMPGPSGVHLLQLWLNLPARLKRTPARYFDLHLADVPVHRETGVEVRVYAGEVGQAMRSHGSRWPLTLLDVHLHANQSYLLPLPSAVRVFAYVLEGSATIGADGRAVVEGDVAWATPGPSHDASHLPLNARTPTRLLVYASPLIDEPVVASGPFVMNTQQEIQDAYADLRAGRLTESPAAPSTSTSDPCAYTREKEIVQR